MSLHRHYKGGLYTTIAWGHDEATLEPVVVYRSEADGTVWVRTQKAWAELVEVDGRQVRRFSPVAEGS